MADDVIASFMVALGFTVNQSSQATAKKSVADYQRAVEQAEKAIEDAKWAGAKSAEDVAKLTRETNLKLARDALQRAKDEEKLELEKAQKRKQRFKEFESDLTKLAAVATAAAAALAVTVGKVTGSFNHLYYVSGRTGASAANLKALGYAFEQTGSSAEAAVSAVEKFTQAMRTNPGVRSFVLNDLHIDPKLDPALQLQKAVETLNEKNKDNPHVAQLQATGLLGLSVEDYNQLTLQGKEIKRLMAERQAFAKSIGLNDDAGAKASERLSKAVGSVVMMFGALRDKLVIALLPSIELLVKRFGDWIAKDPKKLDEIITSLARGFEEFATAVGKVKWEEVFKGVMDFAKGANDAAQAIGGWKVVAEAFFAIWAAEKVAKVFAPIMLAISGIRGALLRLGPVGWAMLGIGTLAGALAEADPNKGIVHGGKSPDGSLNPGDELPGVDSSENRRGGIFARARRAVKDRWNRLRGGEGSGTPGALTALIEAEAKRAGIDPRIMHGIRAGESGHRDDYDKKDDAVESSWGPYQLNRRRGLGVEFEKATGLDVRDPKTIPAQTRWVAEYIAKHGRSALRNWMGYRGDRDADPKWGESGYTPTQVEGNVPPVNGVGGLEQNHGNGVRRQAITDALRRQITAAAKAAGVNAEIYSGGQDESGPNRTGSHRHDHGNAADLKLYTIGQDGKKHYLSMENEAERRTMESFIRESVKAGANGVGSGPGYMGTGGIHVGGGSPAAWGAGGLSANAPDWVRRAHEDGMAARAKPVSLMRPAGPLGANSVTNNSSSRAVNQTVNNNTTIHGSADPKEHGRIIESSLGRVHGLALANLQTAVV